MHLIVDFKLTDPFCLYYRDIESLSRPLLSRSLSHKPLFGCDMSLVELMSRQLADVATLTLGI